MGPFGGIDLDSPISGFIANFIGGGLYTDSAFGIIGRAAVRNLYRSLYPTTGRRKHARRA